MPTPDLPKPSVAELDALIADAAKLRVTLEPLVAMEPPQETMAILDPAWRASLAWPNTVLQLRHLGLGWVTFVLPPHERANLLALFLRQALEPAPPASSNPPSAGPTVATGGGTIH